MKKILIIVAILVVMTTGYFIFNPNFTKIDVLSLDISSPEGIVTKIQKELYSTSTPLDKYSTIRWGEEGTYKNKDISAIGVYLNSADQKLLQYYNSSKFTLEKNGFTPNMRNSFGDLLKDGREDAGYKNGSTICTVGISVNEKIKKYYLSLKCGVFDGVF